MAKFGEQARKLPEEMAKYADRPPVKSRSVSIALKYPVYSDLTTDQLEYYTYWKSTVGSRSFRKAAEGYTWLLMCETLNLDDAEKASLRLNMLATAVAKDGSPLYPELLRAAVEFSVINGTPMPEFSPWMINGEDPWITTMAFSTPITDPPLSFIRRYVPDILFKADPDRPVPELFGNVLRAYEGLMLERLGHSFLEEFGTLVKEAVLPYRGYIRLGRKTPLECIHWKLDEEALGTLFKALASIYVGKGFDSAKSTLPCAEMLSTLFGCAEESGSADPFGKKNGIHFRRLGTPCTSHGPSRFYDPQAEHASRTVLCLGDVLTFADQPPKGPAPFVTSDCEHPTYNDLNREMFAYYQYWKDCFKHGKYLDTDNGYVNLFLTELINTDRGLEAHRHMEKLLEIYGGGNGSLIGMTLMDHCILHNRPFTDYRICMDRYVVNAWAASFLHGENTVPLDATLLGMLRSGSMNLRYIGRTIPMEPFEKALHRIFATASKKTPLKELFGAEKVSFKRSLYFGLEYFRGSRDGTVRYLNYIGSTKLSKFVEKAIDYVGTLMELIGKGVKKVPPFTFSGVNCAEILHEEYLLWTSRMAAPDPGKLVLDMAAVAAAESDLSQVTEMMRVVEEAEKETKVDVQVTNVGDSDPWASLSGSLTDGEREYLHLCIEDPSSTAGHLKQINTTRKKIEDTVNGKALDTVGDTIVENGTPVEDYLEEIRRII